MRLPVFLLALLGVLPCAFAQNAAPSRTERALEQEGISAKALESYPDVRAALSRDDLTGALLALASHEKAHENDPDYYDLAGLLSMKANSYAAAATAFERVVLMQPDNAGAWLDLAVASVEAGNTTAAKSYFDHVEDNFSPSPALRSLIARYRARMAAPLVDAAPGLRFQAEFVVGVDSNANSGLNQSSIPLTINGDRTELALDPSYNARRDNFMQTAVGANYKKTVSGSSFGWSASVRQRNYQHEHDFSTLDLSTGVGVTTPLSFGDLSVWVNGGSLSLGGKQLLRSGRAAVQLEQPFLQSCRLLVGLESEWRRYTTQSNLNSNLHWLQSGLGCDVKAGQTPLQLTLLGRAGMDDPSGSRAGGKSRQGELIGQVTFPIVWGVTADLAHTVARVADEEGYSPLLEDNAARTVMRRHTRLTFTRQIQPGLDAVLMLDDSRVNSNLALFQQRGQLISLGLKKQF